MENTNKAEETTVNKARELAYEIYPITKDRLSQVQRATKQNKRAAFIKGYNSRQSEIDELTKEVERLRNSKELFEKRCINLSKSTDEILEYLVPFVDNNLDDNDINRILKWHNDNSNRH